MIKPLYRIWDIQAQRFANTVEPYYLRIDGTLEHYMFEVEQNQYIIQRCTGEKDINCNYIYEGDIVETHPNVVSSIQAIVNFDTGNFVIEDLQGYEELTFEDTLTIIGNNLENPELLLEMDE